LPLAPKAVPQHHHNEHGHGHVQDHDHGDPGGDGKGANPAVAIQRQPHPRQHEHRPGSAAAFRWSIVLNSALSGLQLVIGFGFGSLALVGDAVHNLGDVAGLLLGWGAERLSGRPANHRFTYGYGRSTQLASLVNAVLILMASAVVVVEGLQRLRHPVEVLSTPVAWAAAAGIVVNLLSARLFGSDHSHDLNRRAAVVHLLTDLHRTGMAVILTTHDINGLAAHLPRIACVNRELIAIGTPREVLTPDVLERTYGAPMEVLEHGGMLLVTDGRLESA
jgi:cobalt-zinc-cadmium efflux system protein